MSMIVRMVMMMRLEEGDIHQAIFVSTIVIDIIIIIIIIPFIIIFFYCMVRMVI